MMGKLLLIRFFILKYLPFSPGTLLKSHIRTKRRIGGNQVIVSETSRNAWTTSGSNCDPAHFLISARAASALEALR